MEARPRGAANPSYVTPQGKAMSDITLSIPCLPDTDLSANRRRSRHYMEQAKDTKAERLNAGLVLDSARRALETQGIYSLYIIPLTPPISLAWTLYFPKGMRAWDWDNCVAALKSWQDAMKDLGWIKGDSSKYVPTGSVTSVPSSAKGPSMELRIESIEIAGGS